MEEVVGDAGEQLEVGGIAVVDVDSTAQLDLDGGVEAGDTFAEAEAEAAGADLPAFGSGFDLP